MSKHQSEALERAKDVIRWIEAGSAPTDAQLFGLSAIQGQFVRNSSKEIVAKRAQMQITYEVSLLMQ
jgi:hypothetical protein